MQVVNEIDTNTTAICAMQSRTGLAENINQWTKAYPDVLTTSSFSFWGKDEVQVKEERLSLSNTSLNKEWYDIGRNWTNRRLVYRGVNTTDNESFSTVRGDKWIRPKKSTIGALVKGAVGWVGNDLDELLNEIKKLRGNIEL
ncbi:MAG: hypothetical protein FD145_213 [Candidatus Saganbacteria bacterium]|uniref:Uncharacterized protein n=1 Tax=Candidatus Saganbacteria bacterium TaxID=2575572 RepID=A0A833P0F3_UNCSA|nr:MAG: hypothetical protein FD145_213 [Candidatus Saganbacteria bacterium]